MSRYLFALHAWNQSNFQSRCAHLAHLHRSTHYAYRSFPFLPSWIRQDLIRLLNNLRGVNRV